MDMRRMTELAFRTGPVMSTLAELPREMPVAMMAHPAAPMPAAPLFAPFGQAVYFQPPPYAPVASPPAFESAMPPPPPPPPAPPMAPPMPAPAAAPQPAEMAAPR